MKFMLSWFDGWWKSGAKGIQCIFYVNLVMIRVSNLLEIHIIVRPLAIMVWRLQTFLISLQSKQSSVKPFSARFFFSLILFRHFRFSFERLQWTGFFPFCICIKKKTRWPYQFQRPNEIHLFPAAAFNALNLTHNHKVKIVDATTITV